MAAMARRNTGRYDALEWIKAGQEEERLAPEYEEAGLPYEAEERRSLGGGFREVGREQLSQAIHAFDQAGYSHRLDPSSGIDAMDKWLMQAKRSSGLARFAASPAGRGVAKATARRDASAELERNRQIPAPAPAPAPAPDLLKILLSLLGWGGTRDGASRTARR